MARVTIEDALRTCPNIFTLIQLSAKRAHQLQRGATPKIPVHETEEGKVDAPTVFALREIAAGFTDFDDEVIPRKEVWGKKVEVHTPDKYERQAIVARDRNKEE